MKIGKWAWVLLGAAPLLAGCKGFWDAPGSSSFTLSNSGNMTVVPGASGTSTITVTPASSFTGTVALTCSITSSPTGATSPATCSLSPTSATISSTAAQTSTLDRDYDCLDNDRRVPDYSYGHFGQRFADHEPVCRGVVVLE